MICFKLAKLLRIKRLKIEPVVNHFERKTPMEREKTFIEQGEEFNSPIVKAVQNIENILSDEFGEDDIERIREMKELKFKFAALVMDRFFFWLSIIYFIITFSVLVLSIPNFYKLT